MKKHYELPLALLEELEPIDILAASQEPGGGGGGTGDDPAGDDIYDDPF